ncbi:hypothetical protein U6X42_12355, partial [Cutibacterium acnes]
MAIGLSCCLLVSIAMFAGGAPERAQASDAENLFVNGSFEQVTADGQAESWQPVRFSGTPQYSVSDAVYKDGSRSYQISADVVSRGAVKQEIHFTSGQAGKPYVMQLWMKTEGLIEGGKAYGRYQLYNSSG